jgi:hypothetical protein
MRRGSLGATGDNCQVLFVAGWRTRLPAVSAGSTRGMHGTANMARPLIRTRRWQGVIGRASGPRKAC